METHHGVRLRALTNSCAVVGDGRVGNSIAAALRRAGIPCSGPHSHGFTGDGSSVVLLCVPDSEIRTAAALLGPGTVLGHCSGASSLDVLEPREAFSLHPLMTIPDGNTSLQSAPCAIAGNSAKAISIAKAIARALQMSPFEVADEDRAAYHAAASVAANYLLAVEDLAERLADSAGVQRTAFSKLVEATVANWQRTGAQAALTGPVARGDYATVERQREAVEARLSQDDLALFDCLTQATERIAQRNAGPTPHRAGNESGVATKPLANESLLLSPDEAVSCLRFAHLPSCASSFPSPREQARESALCQQWVPSTTVTLS